MMNLSATILLAATTGAALGTAMRADESCCAKKTDASKVASCQKKEPAKETLFLAEAQKMMLASEGKKTCCRSTVVNTVAKGESGCCEAEGEPRMFKVFVAGEGYRFFGCEGSAGKGRKELTAKGAKVGPVQKVHRKA